jgi:GT2 family glycosyltransferase
VIADPLVSIIIVTHNNQDDITDCVGSILLQAFQNFEIIIVDNTSTDKTVKIVQQEFGNNKFIRLVKNPKNSWYTGGNNLGFQYSRGKLVAILNPDLVVDKYWLDALVESYYTHADAGIIGSSVLLFDSRERINACGNEIHLTGFVFARFYGSHHSHCIKDEVVAAPSGASFIFSTEKLRKTGRQVPFDNTRFLMDCSDADLAIDFLGQDLLCYVSPSSKVFHKFKFKMNPERLFTLECGRYQILGHFRRKTLFMMLPSLVLTELIVWYFILTTDRNLIKPKLKVLIWLINHSGNIIRNDNNARKDLKLIETMIPDIKLYDEFNSRGSVLILRTINAANRVFSLTRKTIINSLSATKNKF